MRWFDRQVKVGAEIIRYSKEVGRKKHGKQIRVEMNVLMFLQSFAKRLSG